MRNLNSSVDHKDKREREEEEEEAPLDESGEVRQRRHFSSF